jgi:hypothetical protein
MNETFFFGSSLKIIIIPEIQKQDLVAIKKDVNDIKQD